VAKIRREQLADARPQRRLRHQFAADRVDADVIGIRERRRGADGRDQQPPQRGDGPFMPQRVAHSDRQHHEPDRELHVNVRPQDEQRRQQPKERRERSPFDRLRTSESQGLVILNRDDNVQQDQEEQHREQPRPRRRQRHHGVEAEAGDRRGDDERRANAAQQHVEGGCDQQTEDGRQQDETAQAEGVLRGIRDQIEQPAVHDPRFAVSVLRERIGLRQLAVLGDPLAGSQMPPDVLVPVRARARGDDEGAGAEEQRAEHGQFECRDRPLHALAHEAGSKVTVA
jgi:hypothetical protein